MANAVTIQVSWTAPLRWREAGRVEAGLIIRPSEHQLAALSQAIGVEALKSCGASLLVRRWQDGVEVTGVVRAIAVRTCGVTLDLFDEDIVEDIRIRLVPVGSPHARSGRDVQGFVDLDEPDPPVEVEAEEVDLAALLTESLALALPPFPRKPGAVFEPFHLAPRDSPFAALARLKPSR
jgi:hypothetical protein